MKYSLSEAAAATGKNKTTIQRAIKNGKISASKGEFGSYEIDPSELHRVFAPVAQSVAKNSRATLGNEVKQSEILSNVKTNERIADLEKELAVLYERTKGLEEQKGQLTDTIDDLRKRLDSSERSVLTLLSTPEKKGFWKRIFK